MTKELEALLEIKKQFDWPVDLFRYGYQEKHRFWDGSLHSDAPPPIIQERMRTSLRKVQQASVDLQILTKVPWVKMVFITGSVASMNAFEEDDIDVWIVVEERRIWLTRALDLLLFTFTGKRRLSSDGVEATKVKDKFCFNFYSTITSPQLSTATRSFAMQFVDAIPLFIRNFEEYGMLLRANSWVKSYFPAWYKNLSSYFINSIKLPQRKRTMVDTILDGVEYVLGIIMILKAEKKLQLKFSQIFRLEFTTWGTPRILSAYDQETLTEGSKASE